VDWVNVLVPVGIAVVGYAGYFGRVWLKSHVTPKQFATIAGLARTAVEAAEQLGKGTGLKGADKYDMATDVVTTSSARMGVKLKPEEVNAFIHQAVKEMNDYSKQLTG